MALIEAHLMPVYRVLSEPGVSDVFLSDDGSVMVARKKEFFRADVQDWGPDEFWKLLTLLGVAHSENVLSPRDQAWSGILELGGLRLRLCCLGHNRGTRLNMRVLPDYIPQPEQIGLDERVVDRFVRLDQGLVLVCGGTGQGKTTTIASLVQHRATLREENIVTLEDPIEFIFRSRNCLFTQRQLGQDFGSFAQGLKETLRFAPNLIVVGEIRDTETAEIAMQAAETGHVVVATLHTISCSETVRRYIQLVPQERISSHQDTLADVLQMVITQRLVRREDQVKALREIMVKTPGVTQHIRAGDFHLLNQDIETGAKHGMCFFPDEA